MQQRPIGNMAVIILALLYPILWILTLLGIDLSNYSLELIAEILAGTAMILMSIDIFLSLRPRWLEGYFGGLDKMYVTHRRIALTAFGLLIIHFLINIDLPPDQPGTIMGTLALLGITVSVLLAIAPRVPLLRSILRLGYHQWHITHRFMGIFFMMGLIHYIWVVPKSLQSLPGYYMSIIAVTASIAYIYKQFIARFIEPRLPYSVVEVNSLNESITELVLAPKKENLIFFAGQFQLLQIPGDKKLKEKHPFTISSSPNEDNLRLAVKASGDWTRYLQSNVKSGMEALVTGAYGRFNYKTGGKDQIWIAGGIGITPFRSWLRDFEGQVKHKINFFYICRSLDDAVFWEEFEDAANVHPSFQCHLHLSSQDGRITPTQIFQTSEGSAEEKDIYLCGPSVMIEDFSKQFRELGTSKRQIHYEAFKFR